MWSVGPRISFVAKPLGLTSARDFVGQGLCTILSSDYYFASLPAAPFVLSDQEVLPLAEAWKLVSANPANAVGLTDRGTVEKGKRADLLLIDDQLPLNPSVVGVFVRGKLRFLTEPLRLGKGLDSSFADSSNDMVEKKHVFC